MNVGDYVRIDDYISKIEHIRTSSSEKTYVQWKQPNGLLASGNINIIEKSSPNIIDLIEVGDYVNGKLVEDIFDKTNYADKSIKLKGSGDYWYNEHIKSIVTKEQFESMEYKVGE